MECLCAWMDECGDKSPEPGRKVVLTVLTWRLEELFAIIEIYTVTISQYLSYWVAPGPAPDSCQVDMAL